MDEQSQNVLIKTFEREPLVGRCELFALILFSTFSCEFLSLSKIYEIHRKQSARCFFGPLSLKMKYSFHRIIIMRIFDDPMSVSKKEGA
jgi:hypothetical protein